MSIETLTIVTHRLAASMDAIAALGAELRRRRNGISTDSQTQQLLNELIEGIQPGLFDEVTAEQEETALAVIDSFVRQAVDLFENPARPPEWNHHDSVILRGQGLTSRRFIHAIDRLADRRTDLKAALTKPGVLLDVGVGVGWLAIEAARRWPQWRVVGIDRLAPALALAQANIAANGLNERIELREQCLERLDDINTFTIAWLPGAFLSRAAIQVAAQRLWDSLVPGGWLIFGIQPHAQEPWGKSLAALKTIRNGGHPWTPTEAEAQISASGFEHVELVLDGPITRFMVGRKVGVGP